MHLNKGFTRQHTEKMFNRLNHMGLAFLDITGSYVARYMPFYTVSFVWVGEWVWLWFILLHANQYTLQLKFILIFNLRKCQKTNNNSRSIKAFIQISHGNSLQNWWMTQVTTSIKWSIKRKLTVKKSSKSAKSLILTLRNCNSSEFSN
jgi:hypothetical protein